MIILKTTDVLRVVTGASANVVAHVSWCDNVSGTVTPDRTNTAAITSATTTTICAAPGSGQRNCEHVSLFNTHATVSTTVELQHYDGSLGQRIGYALLLPGEALVLNQAGVLLHYTADGTVKTQAPAALYNNSTANQTGFASDTYLTGSFILFPVAPKVGTLYTLAFDMAKTGAGTATPIATVRTGTAGTTADTSRGTPTLSAGTAATDTGVFEVWAFFRSVGSGTSAVLQMGLALQGQPTTGLSSLLKGAVVTSSGFDSTTAGLGIGVSFNGGASFSGTNTFVLSKLENAY